MATLFASKLVFGYSGSIVYHVILEITLSISAEVIKSQMYNMNPLIIIHIWQCPSMRHTGYMSASNQMNRTVQAVLVCIDICCGMKSASVTQDHEIPLLTFL